MHHVGVLDRWCFSGLVATLAKAGRLAFIFVLASFRCLILSSIIYLFPLVRSLARALGVDLDVLCHLIVRWLKVRILIAVPVSPLMVALTRFV